MKKYLNCFIFLIVFQWFGLETVAQDNFEDWLEESVPETEIVNVMDLEEATNFDFFDYWDQHFKAGVGSYYAAGANHSRMFYSFNLSFEDEFYDKFKFTGSLNFRKLDITTKYDLINSNSFNLDTTLEETISLSHFKIREAYVDYSVSDEFLISYGRQSVVWGQLEVFSPIDFFLLPIDVNDSGFSFNKVNNRLPQETAKIVWYPVGNIEITGYLFPKFEVSDMINDLMDTVAQNTDLEYVKPSGSKQRALALRSMGYFGDTTIGFTLFDGWGTYPMPLVYYDKNDVFLEKVQLEFGKKTGVFGIEVAQQMGPTKFSLEYLKDKMLINIDKNYIINLNQWVADNNNRLFSVSDTHWIVFGMDGDYDNWFINTYIYYVFIEKFKGFEKVSPEYPGLESSLIFPSINAGMYFDENKNSLWGLGVGFFQGSAGATLYFSNKFTESFKVGLSLEAMFEVNDLSILAVSDDAGNEENFKSYKFVEPKVRIGCLYDF